MSDDDDYFTDDICFDDQTLAILDHEEKKYLSGTVPPTKRQKTDNGWKAGIDTASANQPHFLPEISLDLGGSYGVRPGTSNSPGITPLPPSTSDSFARAYPNQIFTVLPKPPVVPRVVSTASRNPPAKTFQHNRPPSRSPQRPLDQHHELEARLQELQQKLEKVSEENKAIQTALNEAVNAKLAKEGEVTVLRKKAEKVAQDHAAQLSQLKSGWEEAEAKQARMQKELREEAERLKTQLVFKQHEQESIHRPSSSVRPQKNSKDASFLANSTPLRLRYSMQDEPMGQQSVLKGSAPSTQPRMSSQVKRTTMLPGFENAFSDVTPQRPPKTFLNGKNTGLPSTDPISPTKQRYIPIADMDGFVDETFMESAHIDPDGDVDMPFGASEIDKFWKPEEDEDLEDTPHVTEPPDWKVELNRIVLMHFLPGSHTLTIQLLLGAQITSNLDVVQSDAYMSACSRCLEVIASTLHGEQEWRYSVNSLSRPLIAMIPLLRAAHSRENEKQESHEALATEIITLLEALSFTVDAEHVEKCDMSYDVSDPDGVEEKAADPQKIPLIERLCLYLMDTGRKDNDYKEAKTSILTFFTLLSNSQSDVHAHLLTSTTVIPSLVHHLAQLTAAFWEDDEDLMSATSGEISLAIQTLNQTLFLLHHLVFTSTSFINLRQKLHTPYHRIFNGLMHMFIVTFGRLSYGEAPEWIDREGRLELVSSTEMARDILDLVVDGPEADRTWQAYQLEGEIVDETDEEEMEVQLLGERV
ncbi:hypothetical protein C0991_001669 [Blastosporella zonata]|nr:hypothetical protein C0991_001669 [Blastosporella zonata]